LSLMFGGPPRHWKLQDPEEPELLREVFSYESVPRVPFDHCLRPINPPQQMMITDTTFRDGQQALPPFSVEQMVDLYELLHRLGGEGLIRQCEFFLYTERDREAVRRCLELGYRWPEITGWIRARKEDLSLVREMGLRETGILTSVSDYHIFLKLKKRRSEAMHDYLRVVEAALSEGIVPRCHFEDVTRADIYGFCVPFAIELMKLREQSGINVKIRLCDTLGFGIPYPGAALPRSVEKLVRAMIEDAGVPGELLEWHGHNDFHKALVNAVTAWLHGCAAANGTLLGVGERTGNAPVEALVIEYLALCGDQLRPDTRAIAEIARYFQERLGVQLPPTYPFAGAEFNATKAGIHADGLLKDEEIYNIFDTRRILGRPPTVIITDKSGLAGIAYWVNSHLDLEGDRRVDKRHPGVVRIHRWVMEQYRQGRVTPISAPEMERLARKHLPELFVSEFDRLKYRAYQMAAHLVEEVVEHPDIRSMDPKRQVPVMQKLILDNPFIQFAYVTNLEGRKITPNVIHPEDRAKYSRFEGDVDFSDRPWFINPIHTGRVYVSDLYTSSITGALCVTVSAPIRDEAEEIVGVLGVDIRFEELTKETAG